jgi:hypothetical protein
MVLFSQQSQRLGNGLIRWRQDPDEPERFYVGCLWAIPFSVAMWAVIIWAGRPLAAFGRQHRIPPVTGRPVIFRSPPHPSTPPSKAAQYARLYMQRFGDPLARAIEIAAIPILADGVLAAFAKQIGAPSRFEAFKAWASINASAMPFSHQRLATLGEHQRLSHASSVPTGCRVCYIDSRPPTRYWFVLGTDR